MVVCLHAPVELQLISQVHLIYVVMTEEMSQKGITCSSKQKGYQDIDIFDPSEYILERYAAFTWSLFLQGNTED